MCRCRTQTGDPCLQVRCSTNCANQADSPANHHFTILGGKSGCFGGGGIGPLQGSLSKLTICCLFFNLFIYLFIIILVYQNSWYFFRGGGVGWRAGEYCKNLS